MRYTSAGAFRTALERRLLTQAEQTGLPLVRLRKLVAFDRLLARLVLVAPDRWLLKGAVALHFRIGPRFRTTRDLDLAHHEDEQVAAADLRLTQVLELGDHFAFAIRRAGRLDAEAQGAAVRYHVITEVDGRRFEEITVDVGFGDPTLLQVDLLRGPDLLSFADIQPAVVPTLPLEHHVAEKVHAYTRTYAAGRASTRVKDLVDLAAIASLFPFEAGRLRSALEATFYTRGPHPLPSTLAPPPAQWNVAYRRMAAEVGLDPELPVGYSQVRAFLEPLLNAALRYDATWDPKRRAW